MTTDFQFPADMQYFARRLPGPIADFMDLFDFREPKVKRAEFANVRSKVLEELLARHGSTCLLRYSERCDPASGLSLDHLIPLSSNKLNKELRGATTTRDADGRLRKAPTQSFGSNGTRNLVLACSICNGIKKHRLPDRAMLRRLLTGGSTGEG